jgi:dihydrophenazinedicarboxylate synthase
MSPQASGTAARFETLTAAGEAGFPEYDDPPPAPAGLLSAWLAAAAARGVREPRALALATADARGRPSARIVAISELTADGSLIFLTHATSQKAIEIRETGHAAGVLYWRETGQQISLAGPVTWLPDATADRYWDARPVPLHAMSAASRQSEPLDGDGAVAELHGRAAALEALGTPLPRPERFAAARLDPDAIEFWSPSPDRLHRRLRYDRGPAGWRWSRLQP